MFTFDRVFSFTKSLAQAPDSNQNNSWSKTQQQQDIPQNWTGRTYPDNSSCIIRAFARSRPNTSARKQKT